MKIRLQHPHSGLYVDCSGNWIAAVSEAKEFSLVSDAVNFCNERKLKDVEIVTTFDNPPSECRVPIERALVSDSNNGILR